MVIAVAVTLTGLLMPAMSQLHENAHRIVCMSNMSQTGQGFIMYGHDHNDYLPNSATLHKDNAPEDLMIARRSNDPDYTWDGLGILFEQHYCSSPSCFYCPSHHGDNPYERYENLWDNPVDTVPIYTNYHYAGDIDWKNGTSRRSMLEGVSLVLATDGLRTVNDFNHREGFNALRADGSVRWRDDSKNVMSTLPKSENDPVATTYSNIWDVVEASH